MKYIFLCTALFLPYCFSFPIPILGWNSIVNPPLIEFAKNYIKQYYPSNTLLEGIKKMQKFFHLPITGLLDGSLIEIMLKSRCGLPDVTESDKSPAWNKKDLTYRINNYTQDLPESKVDENLKKAFEVWSDVTPLTFNKTDEPADIEIWFASGAHGDGNPFDGKGGVLAHAYFPNGGKDDIEGDAHFDEDELWSEINKDINLRIVAAHEFGHSLGLEHSDVPEALMAPIYRYQDPEDLRLHVDDEQRIQRLYGKKQ